MSAQGLATVDFHGAALLAKAGNTPAATLVAMRPVVEGMGLSWAAQFVKIKAHAVLGTCIAIIETQVPGDDQVGEHVFMPLNRLTLWLATIQPNKVRDPIVRGRVVEYQTSCADVLFDHFFGNAVAAVGDLPSDRRFVIGGIAKAVVNKALVPIASQIAELRAEVRAVISGFEPGQAVVTDYLPMLTILQKMGVQKTQRRALSQRCSGRMRRWCIDGGGVKRSG